MKNLKDIQILQRKEEFYDHEYPWALDLIDDAVKQDWKFNETNIEGDIQDLKVRLTSSELSGLSETLRLFTLYETKVLDDYWGGFVAKYFPKPEIRMMATRFANDEVIHARAYSEINRVLGWDTKEFMTAWRDIPELAKRMRFIGKATQIPENYDALDLLKAIGTFTFIEGAVLFSSFAFIKHFKANGKNLLTGITSAIDYSVRDESRHVVGGQMLYNTLLEQADLKESELIDLHNHLVKIAKKTAEHESEITKKIYGHGQIIGITQNQMDNFANNRVTKLLNELNVQGHGFENKPTEIEKWFYNNVESIKLGDFFAKQTTAYSKHWDKSKF